MARRSLRLANESMAGATSPSDLKNRGFLTPNTIKTVADFNPPSAVRSKKDSLWFFASTAADCQQLPGRDVLRHDSERPTVFKLNLDPPIGCRTTACGTRNARLTWQATSKNKSGSRSRKTICAPVRPTSATDRRATTSTGAGRTIRNDRMDVAAHEPPAHRVFLPSATHRQELEGSSST